MCSLDTMSWLLKIKCMEKTTIYTELLDEGVRVFAPVLALHLGGRYYKVPKYDREGIKPRFDEGTYVLCLPTKFSGDEFVSLAYCEVSREEAECMLLQQKKDNHQK